MSSSTTFSSAKSSTSPSSSPSPAPTHDNRTTIIIVVLGVIGFIIVACIIYFTFIRSKSSKRGRLRKNEREVGEESFGTMPSQGIMIDRTHPAARITPFGSLGGETPRFKHTPGSDMRIAVRGPNGAWLFQEPNAPFAPSGVSELDVLPSPSSSSTMLPPHRTASLDSNVYSHQHQFSNASAIPSNGQAYTQPYGHGHSQSSASLYSFSPKLPGAPSNASCTSLSSARLAKEQEVRAYRAQAQARVQAQAHAGGKMTNAYGYERGSEFDEYDVTTPPPPAYGHDYGGGGYLDHLKR